MKKAFLTLCFITSASFAMANTIESKEEPTASKVETVENQFKGYTTTVALGETKKLTINIKPNEVCHWAVYDIDSNGNYYVAASGFIDCGSCSAAEACRQAATVVKYILQFM